MKKIITLLLVLTLIVACFAGCKPKFDRENLIVGTKDYVKLCDIETLVFDETDSDYQSSLKNIIDSDLAQYTVEVKEGTVQDGDVTNIDYAGSVDGVAFTGGTAKSQSLTIGSGQFIEGFEDQLIGVKIGDTVTINVTFPEGYNDSTDLETNSKTIKLSGAKAQFVVTVNAVNRPYDSVNDDFAKAAGYDNADAYYEYAKKTALENAVYSYLLENCEMLDYPTEDDGTPYDYYKKYYTNYAAQYNATFEDFLSSNGINETQFKQDILKEVTIMYACFDKLGLELEKDAVDNKVAELASQYNSTNEEIIENYTKNFIEFQIVTEKVMEKLAERASIKE